MSKNLLHFSALLNILYVTELPEVFWTLGTRLSLVLSFFTLRRDFMDLKKPLTFDEQLDKLIAHGLVGSDREEAKRTNMGGGLPVFGFWELKQDIYDISKA